VGVVIMYDIVLGALSDQLIACWLEQFSPWPIIARRPDLRIDEILNGEELKRMRENLGRLNLNDIRQAYHTAHTRCGMVNDRVPSVRSIQEFVQTWKALRRRR